MVKKSLFVVLCFLFVVFGLSGQSVVKSSSINGTTGIISTPTARIGWEYSNFGVDVAYAYLFSGGTHSHVPSINISFLKKAEIGVAVDITPVGGSAVTDILVNGKFQFYREGNSAFAVGGSYQAINSSGNAFNHYGQIYLALSYSGNFFTWPANTSIAIGKTFSSNWDWNIDYSMGFELTLFPEVFKNYVHWISDFGNFSYSAAPVGVNAASRGVFNTGIRIDPIKEGNFKLNFDIVGTDLLDSNRGIMAGICFGWAP